MFKQKEQSESNNNGYRQELNEKLEKFTIQEMDLKNRLEERKDRLSVLSKKRNQALKELNKVK